jgi:glutathione S-transferase
MAIGRDVYIDSRAIITRLEELFPASADHPGLSSTETHGLAALFNKFTVDAGLFLRAVQIMPPSRPSLRSKAFLEDRKDFFGKNWTVNDAARQRPEGLAHVRQCFDIAESFFADGRQWVAGTQQLTLADLEGECCNMNVISAQLKECRYLGA